MQASDSDGPNIFERQVQQTDFHPTRLQSAAVMLMGRNSSDESQQRDEEDEDSSMLLLSSLPATVQGQQQQQNSLMTAATTTAKGGSGLLDSAARSAGLRRSLTLPRNPFSVSKRFVERKYLKILHASSHNTANIIQEPSCLLADSPVADSLKTNMAAGRSSSSAVKNFLARMVNQLSIVTTKRRFAAANAATAAAETNIVATVADSAGDAAWDPDERIREWKAYFESRAEVPGVIGIRNHGNTCFMNAILQCLSYTDLLAEYFVLDQYKADLKRRRRLLPFSAGGKTAAAAAANTGSGSGGRGELTEQLAVVLKSLWSLQYDPEISDKFKSLVDKYGSQYKGGSQHDAQEFLLWLLDKVHEELNMATKKKYKQIRTTPGRPDDVLAAEALANYARCNNSFVVDIFQAQFRSSLTCPTCERQSNTFDPFFCVSLPIPQRQVRPIVVTIVYLDQSPRQVRIGFSLPVDADVRELRTTLARDTGIEVSQLLLAEIDGLSFQKTFTDGEPLANVASDCPLYGIEMPRRQPLLSNSTAAAATGDADVEEDGGAFILLTWVNVFKEGTAIETRFGSPYTIQVSRETTYPDLQKLLMKEMAPILHDDILISAQRVPLFRIRVLDGFEGGAYLDERVELPLYMECVETAVNISQVQQQGGGGPVHVKLVLEWDMPAKTQVIADDADPVEEHSSVRQVREQPEEGSFVTLQECFSVYTSEEKLGQEDAYFCPQCNKKREVVKRLGVWSVPDVLVIHLKRFRQSVRITAATTKLETRVDFPLEGFDMSPNMAPRGDITTTSDAAGRPAGGEVLSRGAGLQILSSAFSPWKHPKRYCRNNDRAGGVEDTMYELYSVCNHHGSDLQGGHYTAYCRNPTDGHWYAFDDTHTTRITETEVVTKNAYILFYQKSCLSQSSSSSTGSSSGSSSSSSSSSSGSSAGSNMEHWAYRMPDFCYKTKNDTRCAPVVRQRVGKRGTSLRRVRSKRGANNTSGVSAFLRNGAKYATLPASSSRGGGRGGGKAPSSTVLSDDDERDHHSDAGGSAAVLRDFSDDDNEVAEDDKAAI